MLVVVLGPLVALSTALVWIARARRAGDSVPSDPARCLEVQLARGEISTEEYHQRRSRLEVEETPSGRFYAQRRADPTARRE